MTRVPGNLRGAVTARIDIELNRFAQVITDFQQTICQIILILQGLSIWQGNCRDVTFFIISNPCSRVSGITDDTLCYQAQALVISELRDETIWIL